MIKFLIWMAVLDAAVWAIEALIFYRKRRP